MKNNKACNINKITALGSVVKVPVNRTRAYNSDTITEIIIRALLIITILLVGYPLYNIVVCSISDPVEVNMGRVIFWPRGINFGGYVRVLKDPAIIRSFFNTIKIMVLGTAINIFLTVPTGYALSRKDLKGNKYILWIYLFTMFFSGGLIPTFLVVQSLGLMDTYLAVVLPGAMSVWNMIVCRTFFKSNLSDEVLESAYIDGAGEIRTFLQIALPLSKTIVALMVFYYSIGHWNGYFNAMIYLSTRSKHPLQLVMRRILLQSEISEAMTESGDDITNMYQIAGMIRYALVVIATVPVVVIFPVIKKHFIQGVMIGSLKS